MSSIVAAMDFDGTLLCGNSFHLLIPYLARRSPRVVPRYCWGVLLRKLGITPSVTFKKTVLSPLYGWDRLRVQMLGRSFYEDVIRPRLRKAGIERLRQHQQMDHQVYVVSGAFEFVLAPFCLEYEVTGFRGTRLEYRAGKFTGKLEGREFLGQAKADYIRSIARNGRFDLAKCHAYSDEWTDLPLLNVVGNGVLVNNKSRRDQEGSEKVIRENWR